MKEIYKNPTLYYILVPVVIALWPLSFWAVYLPEAEGKLKDDQNQCMEAERMIGAILDLDQSRLKSSDANGTVADFDYASAVAEIARLCKIRAANYRLSSGRIVPTDGRRSQSASVVLKDIGIATLAEFVSRVQLRWPKLQCVQLRKLIKKRDLPDSWDADLEFKYYY